MNRKNATRSVLFTSIISLLLCVSMLMGTTFAWFTDKVVSGTNVIAAGNLDVELYYKVEGQTDWTKITETTNIFKENALWEPGHTEVVKLKVVNEGNLALKYQLGVNIASETGSINIAGDPFMLSDFIKFGIVDGEQAYTRDTAIAAVAAMATALNTAYSSEFTSLPAKVEGSTAHEKIVTMVVYMPTEVDNDANHKTGEAVPTINLGINLFATQVEAESDSFGNDYDADADTPAPSYTLDYYTTLKGALTDVKNNTIGTNASIDSSGCEAVVRAETDGTTYVILLKDIVAEDTIMVDTAVILDLNGRTISTNAAVCLEVKADVEIIGSAQDSSIYVVSAAGQNGTAIKVSSGNCVINGGKYIVETSGVSATNIIVANNAALDIRAAVVLTEDTNNGSPIGISVAAGAELNARNCTITTASQKAKNTTVGVLNHGTAVLADCHIAGYADYTASGNSYTSTSNGIRNMEGTMTLYNCYVYGTHAGVVTRAPLNVYGGTYESYGHGGIYYSAANTEFYIEDAIIRYCEMADGYVADSVAGTNKAGMYIGGASNMTIIMDNCTVTGPYYGVVMRDSGGETNNTLNVSNSTFAGSRFTVRNSWSTAAPKLYVNIGENCGFTADSLRNPDNAIITGISYRKAA